MIASLNLHISSSSSSSYSSLRRSSSHKKKGETGGYALKAQRRERKRVRLNERKAKATMTEDLLERFNLPTIHEIYEQTNDNWRFVAIEGAITVAILGLVDAGWSGDWSRIGAITVENENQARWVVEHVVVPGHLITAALTYFVLREDDDRDVRAVKSFVVGFATLFAALVQKENEKALANK